MDLSAIQPGEKGPFGHYFTPPLTLELLDLDKVDRLVNLVGELGVREANRLGGGVTGTWT